MCVWMGFGCVGAVMGVWVHLERLWVYEWAYGCMGAVMGVWMFGCMGIIRSAYGWASGCVGALLGVWVDGCMGLVRNASRCMVVWERLWVYGCLRVWV